MSIQTRALESVKRFEVIEIKVRIGDGKNQNDPIRIITQYFDDDGKLLAENDPARCRFDGQINCQGDHK